MRLFFTVVMFFAIMGTGGICGSPRPWLAGHDVRPIVLVVTDGGIQLDAPIKCEVGELVRFDARKSDVDALVWAILPPSDDFETVDDNRRAFFSARTPGQYLILIAGAKGGTAYLLHHSLTVTGVAPNIGLSSDISKWLKLVPAFPQKKAHARAMAGVFRKLATSDTELEAMLEATALANSAIIGAAYIENWIPFLDKLGAELDRLDESHALATREAYRSTWLEIATALERFARG